MRNELDLMISQIEVEKSVDLSMAESVTYLKGEVVVDYEQKETENNIDLSG